MTSVIVIGAGLAGAAAAWRLAQAGHDVTVLERSRPANEWGSSHGSARIFRYAYPKASYTRLVLAAASGWDELGLEHGRPLITQTGALDFGATRRPEHLASVLAEHGIDHELLSRDEARARWDIGFDTPTLWHPGAGVIDAEQAVMAMLESAVRAGATVLNDQPVERVERTATGYRVLGSRGRAFDAEQVVVAAGGWLPDLLGKLALPGGFLDAFPALEVSQEQAYHFPYRDRIGVDAEDPARSGSVWPTFIHKFERMQVYGLPGGRDAEWRGQKVAEYNGGRRIPSAADHDGLVDDANRRRVVAYVREFLPSLVPEPYAETTCLFTNTPTEDFVIDRVDGITVLAPCSGHGAKFAPLIGEYALALVEGRDAVPAMFRPSLAAVR
ncbi:FAD-dependent oxidoreductase [Plantibacter sp. PA-3-X8]|uniref:FAD-dependent oxidoreductase n=1 Tax=Plantibacter sp. PA-3-X8 TaxID=2480625 RepID=UPI000F5E4A3F|nr:FAD-dependent oxidoreductase [Plantibacter sp. PA-3-X8]AZH83727.1 FAD-dependent oxidoreductase [Plantibacter sp. PA-3-X8]